MSWNFDFWNGDSGTSSILSSFEMIDLVGAWDGATCEPTWDPTFEGILERTSSALDILSRLANLA